MALTLRGILPLTVLAILSGCLAADSAVLEPPTSAPSEEALPSLPPNIHESKAVRGGFFAPPGCEFFPDACIHYPFEVAGTNVSFEATLTWTVPANDFDLHLLDEGGDRLESSLAPALDAQEEISAKLEPGKYRLSVESFMTGPDTFTLDAKFAR